jgi:hypothetical protein
LFIGRDCVPAPPVCINPIDRNGSDGGFCFVRHGNKMQAFGEDCGRVPWLQQSRTALDRTEQKGTDRR